MQSYSSSPLGSDNTYVNKIFDIIDRGNKAIPLGGADIETKNEGFEAIRNTFVELGKVIGDHEIEIMDKTNATRKKLSNTVSEDKIQKLVKKNVDTMKKEVASVGDVSGDSTLAKTLETLDNFDEFFSGNVVELHNDQKVKSRVKTYVENMRGVLSQYKGKM